MSVLKKEIVFDTPPTNEEFWSKVQELYSLMGHGKDYPHQRITVEFTEKVKLQINRRKSDDFTNKELSFFMSNQKRLCYSGREYPRTGWPFYDFSKVIKLSIVGNDDDEKTRVKKVNQFVAKFHPNIWNNIVRELETDPSQMKTRYYDNYKVQSLCGRVPMNVIERIRTAMDNKEDFSEKIYGEKRWKSIELKTGEDGIYRGWFSSEYAGCGNGRYYLLINPTTIAFGEDD